MQFQVACECGVNLSVGEGAAGAKLRCDCGRTIAVPALDELRRRAGLPERKVAPDMVVEALLLAGRLPEEDHCVLCGAATSESVTCHTECERAFVDDGRPSWWHYVLGYLTFGWLGALIVDVSRGTEREWGKDRVFDLPLRICAGCRGQLSNPTAAREALCRAPLYRALLNEYPDATVWPPST
jgi:predicted nucleic acid-binding Zn ribbon protein